MASVTYHVVIPFGRDDEGNLVPGEPQEAPNADRAKRRAQAIFAVPGNVGVIAFARTGDPESGDFSDALITATYGDVDTRF